jgi:hypothetical protein
MKAEERKILSSPPLFPLITASPWSYDEEVTFVAEAGLAEITASGEATLTPHSFVKRTVEENQGVHGLEPLSSYMLDEFG